MQNNNQKNLQNGNLQEQTEEIQLSDYLNIFFRYKWLIISIFVVIVVAATIYTAKAPRIYQATNIVMIEEDARSEYLFTMSTSQKSSINNHIQILKSRPVLDIAYELLENYKDFEQLPISNVVERKGSPHNYLKNRITVENKRETDLLFISFSSLSPLEAKLAVNAVAEALVKRNTSYARMEFTNARRFLSDQLESAELRLRNAEEELRLFKIENGISILSEETKKLIEKSSDLQAELSAAQTDFKVAANHLNYLKSELSQQDSLLANVNSVLNSPLLDQLIKEIVANQTRYVRLLTKPEYSKNHPELIALKEEIENGKDKLDDEVRKAITVKAGSANPLNYRSELTQKIAEAKIERNIAEAKVNSLQDEVEEYNTRMTLLPDTELELARLERNFQIEEKTYETLYQKYEDAKIAEKSKIGNIRIIEEATLPNSPIKPNKKMNLLIGIVMGLGGGLGTALLLNSLDTKIRNFDDIKKYINLPILGTIPFISIEDSDIDYIEKMLQEEKEGKDNKEKIKVLQSQIEGRLVTQYAPKSSTSEAFRILRTNIVTKKKKENEALSAVITSSGPKEGKSTIIANLAITLAQMDEKVILVDLDLRRPMIHNLFGFEKESGASDMLSTEDNYHDYIKEPPIKNLDIITSGIIPPNPSELLASHRLKEIIDSLKEEYDYILFDAPPVIAVTDTMIISKKTDHVAIVVRVELAEKNVVKRIVDIFSHINVEIDGVIVNGIRPHKYYSSYEYNYYYYYYYGTTKGKKKKRLPKILRKDKSIS